MCGIRLRLVGYETPTASSRMSARLPTHDDLPTFECRLGRENLVEQIAREIAGGKPPLVFGVHGDWGSGKTSFLCQLAYELSGDECPIHRDIAKPPRNHADIDNVFTVWFEAWRYQHEPSPVVALLQEMCRQLPRYAAIKRVIGRWGDVLTKGFFGAIDDISLGIKGQPFGVGGEANVKLRNPLHTVHEAGRDWEKEHPRQPAHHRSHPGSPHRRDRETARRQKE